jgi:N6-adenosine-specific RNA methylase IME4/ParB-like chromosome segregation protein Spo0J
MEQNIDAHPYAKMFPRMADAAFEELKRDIQLNGLRQPIILYQGLILDGRHRYQACSDLDIEGAQEVFAGTDDEALQYVISTNLHRRHLNESQRAMVAAELVNLAHGQKKADVQIWTAPVSSADAAKRLNVGRSSVHMAKAVRDHGSEDLRERVKSGNMAVSVAEKIARMPKNKQAEILKAAKPEHAIKKMARAEREQALADKTITTSLRTGTKEYGVIYADPPWKFEVFSANGMDRSADNHYPTMSLDDIKDLKVPATADAVCFLWATVPILPEALKVLEAWGFTYKSHAVWVKDRAGTGYWFRNTHELLLVGTKGNIPAPAMGTQRPSAIEGSVAKHSAKPAVFADMIEELFPNLPKVELFCRSPRKGWDAHGNEI